jgi:hypothetical protein
MLIKPTVTPQRPDLERSSPTRPDVSDDLPVAPVGWQVHVPTALEVETERRRQVPRSDSPPLPASVRAPPGPAQQFWPPDLTNARYANNHRRILERAAVLQKIAEIKGRRVQYAGDALAVLGAAGFVLTTVLPLTVPSQKFDMHEPADVGRVTAMGVGSLALLIAGAYTHYRGYKIIDAPFLSEDLARATGRLADVERPIPDR